MRQPSQIKTIALGLVLLGMRTLSFAVEPVHITLMLGIDFQRPMIEGLLADFAERNPDIVVDMVWAPGGMYETKLKTLIAAKKAPDLIYCGDVWVAYLLPFLLDITPFVERDADRIALDDFYPEIREACMYQGKYYMLPRWFNISLLYYNKDIFDRFSEPYPTREWRWDDYLAAARRMTTKTPGGKPDIWGSQIVTGWWGEWLCLVRQAGGDLFTPDQARCILDEPAAVEGVRFYMDKVHRHGVSPRPGYGPSGGFASGKVAMELGGHTGMWTIYNAAHFAWDIEILPAGPATRHGGEMTLDAIGISKTSQHPEAAWRLLKHLTSEDAIRRQVEAGYLSVRKSVAEELLLNKERNEYPHNITAAYEAMAYAVRIPQTPDFIEIALDVIQPEIDIALEKGETAEIACARASDSANAFLRVLSKGERTP